MGKMVVVLAFEEPSEPTPQRAAEVLEVAKELFPNDANVTIYAGIREVADKVLAVFEGPQA
jgi:hypothetical protein